MRGVSVDLVQRVEAGWRWGLELLVVLSCLSSLLGFCFTVDACGVDTVDVGVCCGADVKCVRRSSYGNGCEQQAWSGFWPCASPPQPMPLQVPSTCGDPRSGHPHQLQSAAATHAREDAANRPTARPPHRATKQPSAANGYSGI